MSIPPGPAVPVATASGRRLRVGAMTTVLVVAAAISVVVLNLLAARANVQWDVTSGGEHRLSPRAVAVLARVREPHEIVVAGPLRDPAAMDQQARRRVEDVVDQLQRQSRGLITFTAIDTGSSDGPRRFHDLLTRLTEREQGRIKQHRDAVATAAASAKELSAALDALSPKLHDVRTAIPDEAPNADANRAYFDQRGAEMRLSARGLRDIAGKAEQLLVGRLDPLPISDTDQAAGLLRPAFADLQTGFAAMVENLTRFAAAETLPAAARDKARELIAGIAGLRDKAGLARDGLERLPRLDLLRIASALRAANAVLVIGPPAEGITAIEFGAILPPPAPAGSRAEFARNAEELFTTALASLVNPSRPIVILMHAQTRAAIERLPVFEAISERLALRGIDLLLWPVAESPEPPTTARLDPAGARPVVYVVFNTAGFTSGGPGQTGQERVTKLAKAIDAVVGAGKPLLLSIIPSNAPSYGDKDPTTAFLAALGIEADSGKPILEERLIPEGRRVSAFHRLQPLPGDHPILRATRGLPTRLEWPVPLRVASPAPDRTTITPLFRVDSAGAWGESQWLSFFQIPISQHPSVPNPPAKDTAQDDGKGPWIVGAAIERSAAGLDHPQRLIVVGSNSWFTDPVLREAVQIDTRLAAANPGNAELFEASVMWLARQDDLIAQSATARAAPLIAPIPESTLFLLKLAATVGLPVVVLLAGVAYRVWRG